MQRIDTQNLDLSSCVHQLALLPHLRVVPTGILEEEILFPCFPSTQGGFKVGVMRIFPTPF